MANSLAWIKATQIFADIWVPFEFDAAAGAATTTQLEADDHYAPTGVTTISDADSLLSTSTSFEQAVIGQPQGISDTGTRGMAINLNDNVLEGFWQWTIPAGLTLISSGCWVKIPTLTAGHGNYFVDLADSGGNYCLLFNITNRLVEGEYRLFCFAGGSFCYTVVNVGDVRWITGLYAQNGTCKAMIFDSAGNAQTLINEAGSSVGTLWTFTDINNRSASRFRIGKESIPNSPDAVTMYIDDWMAAWTVPQFPLGPT